MNPVNSIIRGDCIDVMQQLRPASADFILTDPPYIVRYKGRDGRTVKNDDNALWLKPAFREMHRVLKDGSFCVSFYGWNKIDLFMAAWKDAGFRVVGHIMFRKRYASSSGFLAYRHESAYLLGKGNIQKPAHPIDDVIDWHYTGNRLHPTQKPVECLTPLIEAFCPPGGLVLDPFCGSGSTCLAAAQTGRPYIGIELDRDHHRTAERRMVMAEVTSWAA
jgi:adenine-specific DNA-methyltransferase